MRHGELRNLWSGFWATSLGTLASRVLGLARDVSMAVLLGMSTGGVMDAFVVAFRVPNLFRRVLGEGALATSLLPVFTAEHRADPQRGWQLATAVLLVLGLALTALTLAGEAVCLAVLWWAGNNESLWQLAALTAVLLPYMILACLAAQASAVLESLSRFRTAAVAPAVLNVCWLAAAWWIAPRFAPDKLRQAQVVAGGILISGLMQLWWQYAALARLGFCWQFDWAASRAACGQVLRTMTPIALGLAVTQINTLTDSLIAWGLSAEVGAERSIAWLGHAVDYPLNCGATSAIYFGERFHQLPIGLLGMALATVIYPLLARHATEGNRRQLANDLGLGLRLMCFAALPAGVGMMLVARPTMQLLFEHGACSPHDAQRAADMVVCYSAGVVAFCALPLLVRGHYALGNHSAAARIAAAMVGLDLVLNLSLVWPLGERGLALSTAASAVVQAVLLAATFAAAAGGMAWRELGSTLVRCSLATGAMAAAVVLFQMNVIAMAGGSLGQQAIDVCLTIALGVAVYLAACWLLNVREVAALVWGDFGGESAPMPEVHAAKTQAMIASIGWPKSIARRFRPGTSSRRGSMPS